jgi:hypothetical protein
LKKRSPFAGSSFRLPTGVPAMRGLRFWLSGFSA